MLLLQLGDDSVLLRGTDISWKSHDWFIGDESNIELPDVMKLGDGIILEKIDEKHETGYYITKDGFDIGELFLSHTPNNKFLYIEVIQIEDGYTRQGVASNIVYALFNKLNLTGIVGMARYASLPFWISLGLDYSYEEGGQDDDYLIPFILYRNEK